MASGRILRSILRSSSRRSAASKYPISNTNPMLSTPPSLSCTRASDYGYLLNSTSEYATSVKPPPPKYDGNKVIVDEFAGKRSTGQVCRLNGSIADVRFEEGLPEIGTKLKVLDNRTCSVDGTEGLAIGQRVVLNTESTIRNASVWCLQEDSFVGGDGYSTGQVCRLNGNAVEVRFEEGRLPLIGSMLKVLDNSRTIRADADGDHHLVVVDHLGGGDESTTVRARSESSIRADAVRVVVGHLGDRIVEGYGEDSIHADAELLVVDHLGDSIVRACWKDGSVGRTEGGLVLGQRVLDTGLPIFHYADYDSDWFPSDEYYGDEADGDREEFEQELEVLEQEDEGLVKDLIPEMKQVYVKSRRYLLEKRLQQKKVFKWGEVLPDKFFGSSTLRNGSIGTVCWMDGGGDMVDVRFPNKLWFGTTHLEVLPATLDVFPDTPLVLKVLDIVYPSGGDESVVRATIAENGAEEGLLVLGAKVFGFPMYKPSCARFDEVEEDDMDEIPELNELEREVRGIRDELRFIVQEEEEKGRKEA